ncbi:MFS family permease [Bradyrhizobium sp. LM6.10]
MIWIVFMLNLAEFYALQSWLPSMLTNAGHSLNTVTLATSMTTVGGITAAFAVGPAMDRIGPYGSLATVYLSGVLFVILFGYTIDKPNWIMVATAFCAGFCISGGQKSVIALAAIFYPTAIRSTGCGLGSRNRQTWRHWRPAADWGFARLSPQRAANSLCCWDPDAAGRIAHSPARPLVWAGY